MHCKSLWIKASAKCINIHIFFAFTVDTLNCHWRLKLCLCLSQEFISTMATLRFGQHIIKSSAVFLKTELSFALVNRKPVVPGRILFRFTIATGVLHWGESRAGRIFSLSVFTVEYSVLWRAALSLPAVAQQQFALCYVWPDLHIRAVSPDVYHTALHKSFSLGTGL